MNDPQKKSHVKNVVWEMTLPLGECVTLWTEWCIVDFISIWILSLFFLNSGLLEVIDFHVIFEISWCEGSNLKRWENVNLFWRRKTKKNGLPVSYAVSNACCAFQFQAKIKKNERSITNTWIFDIALLRRLNRGHRQRIVNRRCLFQRKAFQKHSFHISSPISFGLCFIPWFVPSS